MLDFFNSLELDLSSDDISKVENAKNKAEKLCMSDVYQSHNKFNIFQILLKHSNELAMELLSRWRDTLVFCENGIPPNLDILVRTSRTPLVPSHERIYTVVHLYNIGYFMECYKCFSDLTFDISMDIKHRCDAAKFLFTADDEWRDVALESLTDIISELSYTSKFRYEVIASYISKTGISSLMNFKKLKVPYDETFVLSLQLTFFEEKNNQKPYRILSGQNILQNNFTTPDTKKKVITELFEIADDTENTENIRADATDVILRLGDSQSKKRARKLIMELGYGGDGRKMSIAERIKTVYNDSQNVHNDSIYKCIEKYVEKIMNDSGDYKLIKFEDTIHQIKIYTRSINQEKYKNCKQNVGLALDRISVDSATFTKNKVSLSELLCHIWSRISSDEFTDKPEVADDLKLRLFEELYEMTDTCSSGHAARLVNVMSSVDENMMISWDDQIKSNLLGRIQAKIKECNDPDISSSIALGMMEDADEEDRDVYIKWLTKQIDDIEIDLYKEFVEDGYIQKEEFEAYFKISKSDWL